MIENLTGYVETDPNSRITVISSKVTWTLLSRGEDAYVYKDKGVAYFAGNFQINFKYRVTGGVGAGTTVGICSLANLIDDRIGIDTANGDLLTLLASLVSAANSYTIYIIEIDAGTQYSGVTPYETTLNTDYYLTIKRDESVGTYGTLYCYIYSDSDRQTLLATQSIALHSSKKDFRYLYAVQSGNDGETALTHSGYVEDFEIISVSTTPVVTTEPCTAIADTTATGNGTISNLGGASVTQHGHCWGTSVDPTTADSKTTLGTGALGAFTSNITGITKGQLYYVRAYATNTEGTSYGANVSFTAGYGSSQLPAGLVAVKGTTLRYVDDDGKERYLTGTLV